MPERMEYPEIREELKDVRNAPDPEPLFLFSNPGEQ